MRMKWGFRMEDGQQLGSLSAGPVTLLLADFLSLQTQIQKGVDCGTLQDSLHNPGLTTADCPENQREGGFLAGPLLNPELRGVGAFWFLAANRVAQSVLHWESRSVWQVSWPQASQAPRAL